VISEAPLRHRECEGKELTVHDAFLGNHSSGHMVSLYRRLQLVCPEQMTKLESDHLSPRGAVAPVTVIVGAVALGVGGSEQRKVREPLSPLSTGAPLGRSRADVTSSVAVDGGPSLQIRLRLSSRGSSLACKEEVVFRM
jgi:hypothetical protein